MRKLIMWNVMTLDGYFEGEKNWDLSFHETVWGPELESLSIEQLQAADYLVFGRVTYEGMAAYWTTSEEGEIADYMNSLPKIVCSRTLDTVDWNNSILLKKNVPDEIRRLKAEGDRDMYVFGSSILCRTLIAENLFDEYRICIAPVLLGKGRRLFQDEMSLKNLTLISAQPLANGGVLLMYKP